jgi:hypothetical protein
MMFQRCLTYAIPENSKTILLLVGQSPEAGLHVSRAFRYFLEKTNRIPQTMHCIYFYSLGIATYDQKYTKILSFLPKQKRAGKSGCGPFLCRRVKCSLSNWGSHELAIQQTSGSLYRRQRQSDVAVWPQQLPLSFGLFPCSVMSCDMYTHIHVHTCSCKHIYVYTHL